MSAYCRLCNQKGTPNSDTYIACNNCGSFACARHHVWFGTSKNAFCTICFPNQAAAATTTAIEALQTVVRNANSGAVGDIYGALSNITREFQKMSLDDLIRLLISIRDELARRGAEGA
jgi:hypothetical protein